MGDFKEITHESENVRARCKPISQMVEFILEKCHLKDLGFVGPKFTWWNMQDGVHFIKERLDRVVANYGWLELFPIKKVEVLASRSSDHAPLLLYFQSCRGSSRLRRCPFRYEATWRKNNGCKETISQV
jgi:hypothetical protein